MEKHRLKGFLHVSDTRGGGDHTVGRFVRMESSGERKLRKGDLTQEVFYFPRVSNR